MTDLNCIVSKVQNKIGHNDNNDDKDDGEGEDNNNK